MKNQNGIHIYVDPATLQAQVGSLWIPLPEAGVADLAPEIAAVLRPACGLESSSSHRELHVSAATWEAVLARAAEIVAADAKRAQEHAAREEREKIERAERTVKWREAVSRYLGGEDLPVDPYYPTVGGIAAGYIDVTDEEKQTVREEHARRKAAADATKRAKQEEQEQAKAARASAIRQARVDWLDQHGYAEVAERCAYDVLCNDELRAFLRQHAPSIDDMPRYQKRTLADIEHCDSCEADVSVSWDLEIDESVVCSAAMWARLKAIRAFYTDMPNIKIEIRKHTALLSCHCPDPVWYGVLVTIAYPAMDFAIAIEYDLNP